MLEVWISVLIDTARRFTGGGTHTEALVLGLKQG